MPRFVMARLEKKSQAHRVFARILRNSSHVPCRISDEDQYPALSGYS